MSSVLRLLDWLIMEFYLPIHYIMPMFFSTRIAALLVIRQIK